jgi:alanine racemase
LAKAIIDLNALRHNYQYLKNLSPESKTLAVIKADAYGHGLIQVAQALENTADGLAVARLEEALKLREAGIENSVLLLDGFLNAKELQSAISHRFKVVIHDFSQLELLEARGVRGEIDLYCWLKVNTGMNRLGFFVDELPEVVSRLEKLSWLRCETLMTHFANADSGKKSSTKQALKLFKEAKNQCAGIPQSSLANSAAMLAYPETLSDWNRPGISLFGCSTLPEPVSELKPVMHLSAPVIAIHKVRKGEAVGYGSIWKAQKDTQIAVVGIGYGDGYPRHAKNGTPVAIGGETYLLAGRVSMDMITVDLGENKESVKVGDQVILWGDTKTKTLSADEVAKSSETISYELFCKVTQRVHKEYVGG